MMDYNSSEMRNFVSYLSSEPLFSMLITLYTLLLLYFPACFFNLIFSPVVAISTVLLLAAGRLGSNQTPEGEELLLASAAEAAPQDVQTQYIALFTESMVSAPLQVIYEEYEGEDMQAYYPESDTDTSSDGDFLENMCFQWDTEDDKAGLIEISLADEKRCFELQVEEDNFIEIDIGALP